MVDWDVRWQNRNVPSQLCGVINYWIGEFLSSEEFLGLGDACGSKVQQLSVSRSFSN
jgi:hypothetical protein